MSYNIISIRSQKLDVRKINLIEDNEINIGEEIMNRKKEDGAIAIFVLVALLFMAGFLIIVFAGNLNKSKTIKEQFEITNGIYAYSNGEKGAYDKAYTDLRRKNKQIMTASVENNNTLELTKTYADKISNYRIYGNSVQNGTPTPDNPVEVQSVGDLVNLLDASKFIRGGITGEGVDFGSTSRLRTDFIPVDSNETYTITMNTNLELDSYKHIHFYDENKITISYIGTENSFTVPDNAKYIKIVIQKKDATQNFTDEEVLNVQNSQSQLEKGNVATEYAPYGKYRIPIQVHGKNLFDEQWEVGMIGVNNGDNQPSSNSIRTKNYISISANTEYHFKLPKGQYYYPIIYKKDKAFSRYLGMQVNSFTFKTTEEEGYIKIFQYNSTDIPKDAQLEKGTIATDYEKYKSQIFNIYLDEPLRKVGDAADYIDFKTGKVNREVGEIVLDTNWEWDYSEDYDAFFTGQDIFNGGNAICSHFRNVISGLANNDNVILINNSFTFISYDTLNRNIEQFKQFLANNSIKVISALAKPLKLEMINLPELTTYEDYTQIEVLTDITPSKIEAEYTGYTLD